MSIYRYCRQFGLLACGSLFLSVLVPKSLLAETVHPILVANSFEDINRRPGELETLPSPQFTPPELPSLPGANPMVPDSQITPTDVVGRIRVRGFRVEGGTVFGATQLCEVIQTTLGVKSCEVVEGELRLTDAGQEGLSFAELLKVAEGITKLYVDRGYITSGAFIPVQTFPLENAVVRVQILEGRLDGEDIKVKGAGRLNPSYIRGRIQVGTGRVFNVNRLLDTLQLLRLDPLLDNVAGELSTGVSPGTSVLDVQVTPGKTRSVEVGVENNRSPSVGSLQRKVQLQENNLLGLGDSLNLSYRNTDGSNGIDVRYTLPVNSRHGTVEINYGNSSSRVIQKPFDVLDIEGKAQELGITFRQPLIRTSSQEFAVGVTANHRDSEIVFLEGFVGEPVPYPALGADGEGRTRISAVRLFQDWTQRSTEEVISARSQFSFGVNAFDATINNIPNSTVPDGEFFAWRGQGQYVRRLGKDALLLVRGDVQLADRPLLASEQVGVGGQGTVRGYRQDLFLVDNAFIGSVELRYPVLRVAKIKGVLQVAPFFDFGAMSNHSIPERDELKVPNISSVGLGLLWQQQNLSARFDWGIPLTSIPGENKNNWQENELHFSVMYRQPF